MLKATGGITQSQVDSLLKHGHPIAWCSCCKSGYIADELIDAAVEEGDYFFKPIEGSDGVHCPDCGDSLAGSLIRHLEVCDAEDF